MEQLEKLIRSIEFTIKHTVQFDIDWMNKTNSETPGVYTEREINFALGKKKGLLFAIELAQQEIKNLECQAKFDEFITNSNDILDKMHKLIDEKQLQSDIAITEV